MANSSIVENVLKNGPRFRIENNILIGDEKPVYKECMNVGKLVLEKLRSRPDHVGQVYAVTEEETTYAEMTEKSVKCAMWLKNQGVKPGDVIGICTNNHLNSYVPLFSSLYVAAIANSWDSELSNVSARYFLSLITPKVVFVHAESAKNLREAAEELNQTVIIVVFDELEGHQSLGEILKSVDCTGKAMKEFECEEISEPRAIAVIVSSSGTTGFPKGTEISHSAMINYMSKLDVHDLEGHISMWTPTMRWYCGLFIIVQAILKYSKRVIIPDYDDDDAVCQFIEKYKVSWFRCDSCFPIRLVKFDKLKKYTLPTLKVLLFGGSHFRRELQESLTKQLPHTYVLQSYGMTDFGGLCTCQAKISEPGSCGFICPTARLKIIDLNTGAILGPNQTGEIWAKSSYMMNRYHKNPGATANALDSEGWLHTGDLGYYNENAEIFLVERLSEFINYRAINVSPAEIEAVLLNHHAVLAAAVVPVPHEIEEENAMGFVVIVPGKNVTEKELMELVDNSLPWFSRLHAGLKFMEKLPRTTTGKIAKKELKQLATTLVGKSN